MTSALQLEILDLRHFNARELRPVLEAESQLWSERLLWDYRSSADLLLSYLNSHVLPGYVALDQGRVCGYVFCVYEGSKAVIGDLFAAEKLCLRNTPQEVESILLRHLLELLEHSPGMERIEAQLLLHPHRSHWDVFLGARFEVHRRLFMELDLPANDRGNRLPAESLSALRAGLPAIVGSGLTLRRWQDNDFQSAGRLITEAYTGHLDSRINDQYRSVSGSMRFLQNIIRFPGCGVFDTKASWVVADGNNELQAILLCSRVGPRVGHVTQVCVSHAHRNKGLGRLLLERCGLQMAEQGCETLTLTVTEENRSAVELYMKLGYRVRHTFDAMVWTKERTTIWPGAKSFSEIP